MKPINADISRGGKAPFRCWILSQGARVFATIHGWSIHLWTKDDGFSECLDVIPISRLVARDILRGLFEVRSNQCAD